MEFSSIENAETKHCWGFILMEILSKMLKKWKTIDLFHWKDQNKVQLGI